MKYILILGLIVLVLVIAWFVWQFYKVMFRGYAPIISTGPKVLIRILEVLNPTDDYKDKVVYELGCGRAHFLQEFEKMYPEAKLIGIEYDWLQYAIARIQLIFRKSKIKMRRRDLFRAQIKDADLIYCFLNKAMMDDLEKKFKFECKMRTKVISHQFPLPNLRAEKVIEVEGVKAKKGYENKVYFYEI